MRPQPDYVENELDSRIERFDASWERGVIPDINDYLLPESSESHPDERLELLAELIMIDLEYRWRRAHKQISNAIASEHADKHHDSFPSHPHVEDYLAAFPELRTAGKLTKVIVSEYRTRHRWGDTPGHEEFLSRFPNHTRVLLKALHDVNQRLPRASRLWIRCPHCHAPLDTAALDLSGQITCTSCHRGFRLIEDKPSRRTTPGARLGAFQLIEPMGSGSFGTVWRARDTELDRDVAIKIPHRERLEPRQVEQFVREARTAAQLSHPHIVRVYEVGRDADTVFVVSDLIDGAPLSEWLTERRLSVREAAVLSLSIVRALDHAHRAGVIHRDLKPSNIIIDRDGQPHLTDFGLARREVGEVTITREGQLLGTPAYMSPEQAKGEAHRADQRSDIYSVGVILYELLAGELPFRGSVRVLMQRILHDDAASPRMLNSSIPRDLDTICLKCLEKDPAKRYSSASELAHELQRFLDGESIRSRPISKVSRCWRWCQRKPANAVAIGSLLLFATAAPLVAISQGRARMQAETARAEAHAVAAAAKDAAERYRWKQYASDMKVAISAWESANVGRVLELLRQHVPQESQKDLRGFEWYYLWQLCRPSETTKTFPLKAPAWVAFSPDGKTLAATGRGMLHLWDLETDQKLMTLDPHQGRRRRRGRLVPGLAFSPDGQILAAAGWDCGLKLWRLQGIEASDEPDILTDERTQDHGFYDLAFSPDGKSLATDGPDNEVLVWSLGERRVIRRLKGHRSRVWYLAFSHDGRLVSGSGDGEVRLWDVKLGEGAELLGHEPGVTCVTFSPDGGTILSGGEDNCIKLWNVATRQLRATLRAHTNQVYAVVCSPDGQTFASASRDGTVKLWNIQTLEQLGTIRGHSSSVMDVAFSPDGQQLVSVGLDHKVKLWDVSAATTTHGLEGTYVEYSWQDGALLTRNRDVLSVWNPDTLERAGELASPTDGCVGRSPDGQRIAIGHPDGRVEIRSEREPKVRLLPVWDEESADAVQFSPDGRYLASTDRANEIGKLKIWDLSTSTELAELEFYWLTRPAFSPDWSTIATSSVFPVYAIQLCHRTGQELASLPQQDPIFSFDFSSDGKTLAAGSWNGEIQIWDVETLQQLFPPLTGHVGVVEAVTFSPDRKRLASCGRDRTVKLWDLSTGDEMVTLKGHRRDVTSASFSPDGNTLASASDDGTVLLWRAASEEEVRRVAW